MYDLMDVHALWSDVVKNSMKRRDDVLDLSCSKFMLESRFVVILQIHVSLGQNVGRKQERSQVVVMRENIP